mmetsp:Transcript_40977/g.98817  ORF Transcript_40977/g.98817 Transcript_40977/m.98817 type:complete len:788 (+) Transcript_40977:134-2497(+)
MGAPSVLSVSSPAHQNSNEATIQPEADLEVTYTSLIQQYLQVMCLENATFLAERMVAACKSTNSRYLLALCYYRSSSPQRALVVLDDVKEHNASTKYLTAKCCYDLEQYGRAEEALLHQARELYRDYKMNSPSSLPMDEWIVQTSPAPIPNGAVGLHLLGNVCRRSNRKRRATDYYKMSLQLDPLLWSSYEALCEIGATDIDPTSVFGVHPPEMDQLKENVSKANGTLPLQEKSISSPSFNLSHHQTPKPLQNLQVGTPSSATPLPQTLFQTSQNPGVTPHQLQFETPNLTPIPTVQDHSFIANQPASAEFMNVPNSSTVRRAKQVAARLYYEPTPETPISARRDSSRYLGGRGVLFDTSSISETPLRRGGRPSELSTARKPRALFLASENKRSNDVTEVENIDYGEEQQVISQNEEENDNHAPPHEVTKTTSYPHIEPMKEEEELIDSHRHVEEILKLMCMLGGGYCKLCNYRCRESLQIFEALPRTQRNTGWVLHQEGRAYFEMADYENAQRSLELMQRVEPHRMKGLELLSTVLWQLKKEVEIAHLAQKAVDFDRLSPEAWCVVGNCFSLQKEHETALVFFGRSLQLNPSFTYTHTLSGYEYMANEDFDKAVACFRNAIRLDERHYNAWYGLGAIYHRQEKYDLAEYHFQRAVAINSQSSVLRCNLGMSQYSNGKALQALDTLAEAFRLDPNNPQARFQRATIYVQLNRPEDALKELEKVRDAAPREATVHFAMGKVLKRLGRSEQAMRCFLTALDLDPKDNQMIKSAMDKLDEPDVDEEVAAF